MPRTLPDYLVEETNAAIRSRMLSAIDPQYDVAELSFFWDVLAVYALELAIVNASIRGSFLRSFVAAEGAVLGEYLDLRGEENGIDRREAAKATGVVTFTGDDGTEIPAGTTVATLQSEFTPSVVFVTTEDAEIPTSGGATGTVDVAIEARDGGANTNVGADRITVVTPAVAGVSGVNNVSATTGGTDIEEDDDYLERYLIRRRNPTTSGNKAHYVNWSLEVPGVGAVSVIPVRDGPGTVSVAIVNSDNEAADQALIDLVQDYIAPPHELTYEAEAFTLSGFGASVDATQTDDEDDSVKFVYDVGGDGQATQSNLQGLLPQAGIWMARIRVKRGASVGSGDLLQYGIYNVTAGDWARTKPSTSLGTATTTISNAGLATSFTDLQQNFYWNGTDTLELRVIRKVADTTTDVWLDQALYRSTFSTEDGDGLAPIGAQVTVESGTEVLIYVEATVVVDSNYIEADVLEAVEQNIIDYTATLVFKTQNDVFHSKIGNEIIDTPGVTDYSGLKIGITTPVPGAGTSNIAIGAQEFAMATTASITLTT